MNSYEEISREDRIKLRLKRGDKKKIAQRMGVDPEWVSRVIRGKGVSEPVLRAAEQFIAERDKSHSN